MKLIFIKFRDHLMLLKIAVFLDVIPCSQVESYQFFFKGGGEVE